MTPNRWREIEECYHEAMGREPASRTGYLAQLDPDIRAEVEELLAQRSQDSPLDHRSNLFEALTPGAMLGHYRIEQSIGAGGMGEVYRATDTKLRRSVAIKVCGAGFIRRFEREARAIAALNHPNICTLYESGPDYLVMELVEGPTLADQIRKGAIPINEAIDIARQIAEALEAAHEHGIIHRDLKPANIKLTADGRVKVLDFGLAKSITPAPPDAAAATITNTEQGLIVGTPSYMSPEQAEGLPTDKRADIWSFGVVLWEMLTGHRLFDAQSASRILSEVLQREIDFDKLPAAVPDHIRALLRRCLDRNLKTRLRDIGEARIALLLAPQTNPTQIRKWTALAHIGWLIALAMTVTWIGTLAFYVNRKEVNKPALSRAVFQITAPEYGLRDISISPDGRTILLLGNRGNSKGKIWIRSLDRLDTRLLITVPGLLWYAWSPDSEFICYQTGTRVYRIARRVEEQPALIGEAPNSIFEGVWINPTALVLASREAIFRLDIPSSSVTRIYTGGFGLTELPNDHFAFARADGVYAGWLDGRKEIRISSRTVGSLQYVPAPTGRPGPGHMLFGRDGLVQAQLFDPNGFQFRGVAVPLFEIPGNYSASQTGAIISSYKPNVWQLAWFDRSGQMNRIVTSDLHLAHPNVQMSPDETRALVCIRDTTGIPDVWIVDLRSGALSRLSFNGTVQGVWSPDSRSLLLATRSGDQYLRLADGSGPGIPWPQLRGFPTDWSADGRQIMSVVGNQNGGLELWNTSIDPASGNKSAPYLQHSSASLFGGKFSPTGPWVAYVSQTQIPSVFVESLSRGHGRWQITTVGGAAPQWKRDGTELFFLRGTELWTTPVKQLAGSLEFGKSERLFGLPVFSRYQATRDGQRFLVSLLAQQEDSSKQVVTVDTDWRAGLLSR